MAIKYLLAALFLLAGAAGVGAYLHLHSTSLMTGKEIRIGSSALSIEVADTESAREQGLSGRAGLPEGKGMLFVFEQDGTWGIWMKDMLFSIDIIWMDAAGTVLTVAAKVSPDSYPKIFFPVAPARYVLEVPAGYARKAGIAEGVKIVL